MPSYPHSWLYASDPFGAPQEIFNGARLARNLTAANLCGSGLFDNIAPNLGCDGYAYAPTAPPALSDAVLWLDARDGSPTREIAPNRGTGGPMLNGTLGATTASSTDQPLWLGGTEKYLYTPAVLGNTATAPNSAPLQITGDIEIVVRASIDTVGALVNKYTSGVDGYMFQVNAGALLTFRARLAGSDIFINSTFAVPVTVGTDYWLKVTRVASTGAVSFWYAVGGNNAEPPTYIQLGTTVAGTAGNIVSGTTAVTIGEFAGTLAFGGKIFRAMVRPAIAATTPTNVLDINFTSNTSQTSFTATAGGVVTINRSTTGRKSVAYQGRPLWLFGTDDYITIPDHPLLDFAANESFTILAVQRTHNIAVGSVQAIVAKHTGSGVLGWSLFNGVGALSDFNISDGSVSIVLDTAAKTAGALSVVSGVRNVTADTATSYLNGILGSTSPDATTTTLATSQPLRIGGFSGGASPLDGEVMTVMLWRRALTAAEVTEVSNFFRSTTALAGQCWTPISLGPGTDPWYDYRLPESLEAYGFLVEEWTGLDGAHHARNSSPTGQNRGGAYYGPQSHNQRTWKINVLLHGSTERGLDYLFRWLESKLLNCCGSDCDSQFAWIRTICPYDPVNVPQEGVLRGERVVLLEGPTWEAAPVERAGCYLRRVSLTLGVGDPCLYREAEPLAYADVTTTGAGASGVLSNCATFNGDQRQVRAEMNGPPGYGLTAPVVTITSPAQSINPGTLSVVRAGLPVLRIAGYRDPLNTGDPCRSQLIGEIIIEAKETSGYEIVVDMAKRKIRMRAPGDPEWFDGSRLIGRALRPGLTRWWSFGPCDAGIVVVEPAYTALDVSRFEATPSQVTQWSVRIEAATRVSCC